MKNKKFIGISSATLMAISILGSTASPVFAAEAKSDASQISTPKVEKVENPKNDSQSTVNASTTKKESQKSNSDDEKLKGPQLSKNSSIGPGYYSSAAGFQNVVNALHADGTQVKGSNKVFKTGSRWKVKYTRVINGEICYLVGNDEYIPKKYTQWGKGE